MLLIVSYDTTKLMTKPPFKLTPRILNLVSQIHETLGELKTSILIKPSVKLRKENKIKTVKHSLAIEGNELSEEQITALLEKKKVSGPKKQIQEVVNALNLYEKLHDFNPLIEKDLLKAHTHLMKNLMLEPGKYRSKNVGVLKGSKISRVAPQAKFVPELMKNLFVFLKSEGDMPTLIKGCIFHYELKFIHPFEDGNGRMGRLWQQLILMKHSPIFEFVSVETLIHQKQQTYYKVLEACDKAGDSTLYIEFSLEVIRDVLKEFKSEYRPARGTSLDRITAALELFGTNEFTRKEYLNLHKNVSTATGSRDLAEAVENGLILRNGEKSLAVYKRSP